MTAVPVLYFPFRIVTQAGSTLAIMALVIVLNGSLLAIMALKARLYRARLALLAKWAITSHNEP